MSVLKVNDLIVRLGLDQHELDPGRWNNELLPHLPPHVAYGLTNYLNSSNKDKLTFSLYEHVDSSNVTPFLPEYDDLLRLYHLARTRKCLNVLEFGLGYSTLFFAVALHVNETKYAHVTNQTIRRRRPYKHYSVDTCRSWIRHFKRMHMRNCSHQISNIIDISYSHAYTSEFNGRVCTFYKSIPNILPDLIYLDGPDQFSPRGQVGGISTRSSDRMPMAGDILRFEHFLQPGTIIIVDGRAANARFLFSNLQRQWIYEYFESADQHIFLLDEDPLGVFNQNLLAHIYS